jgi:hypothetical protein
MAITNPHHSEQAERLFKPREWRLEDDQMVEISDLVVHSFTMGDVEDPDLYAAQPLSEWQNSEMGKWVLKNAVETPFWHRMVDPTTYGHRYHVVARMRTKDQTFFQLKWGKK